MVYGEIPPIVGVYINELAIEGAFNTDLVDGELPPVVDVDINELAIEGAFNTDLSPVARDMSEQRASLGLITMSDPPDLVINDKTHQQSADTVGTRATFPTESAPVSYILFFYFLDYILLFLFLI